MELGKEEDNDCEKEKVESPIVVDDLPLAWRTSKDHPINNILEDITKGMTTRSKISNFCYHFAFISQVEPKMQKMFYLMSIGLWSWKMN